jgi:hypothetical protein
MKPLLLTLLVLIQGIAYASDDKPEIRRYQLLYAVTYTGGPGGGFDKKTVWKIDTVTGQVWKYSAWEDKDAIVSDSFEPVETKAR